MLKAQIEGARGPPARIQDRFNAATGLSNFSLVPLVAPALQTPEPIKLKLGSNVVLHDSCRGPASAASVVDAYLRRVFVSTRESERVEVHKEGTQRFFTIENGDRIELEAG